MHWQLSDLTDRFAGDDRTGLIFVDEYGHRRDYTFAEVVKHALQYAAVLRAFGIHEQDRVYVCCSTAAKCVFTLLALDRVGAPAILDEAHAAGATAIVSNRVYRAGIDANRDRFSPDARYLLIGEECEGWARLDTLAQRASAVPPPATDDEPPLLHDAREAARARLGAVATDTVWCAQHIEDRDWFVQAVARPWLCGAAAVVHNGGFDARERLDLIRELSVTILLQPADEYHAQLALPEPSRFKMPRLRKCVVLGEGFDELLREQWAQAFGVPLAPETAPARPQS